MRENFDVTRGEGVEEMASPGVDFGDLGRDEELGLRSQASGGCELEFDVGGLMKSLPPETISVICGQ